METKSKQPINVLNVGGLLVILSLVGNTPRFMVISLTLISWLQTQWLGYVSILQKRRAGRLAAEQTRHKKQTSDIAESVGENPIVLLDKRQERVLKVSQDAERIRHIVKGVIDHLMVFQENEKVQFKGRENILLIRERKVKDEEASLQGWKKKLEEREQKTKVAEDSAGKLHLKQDQRLKDRQEQLLIREKKIKENEAVLQLRQKRLDEQEQKTKALGLDRKPLQRMDLEQGGFGQRAFFTPAPHPTPQFSLPSDLLEYAEDLKSGFFTCIGVTQKGARCRQSFIANADKSAAASRIAVMRSVSQAGHFELDALKELADWMLCPRWHRYAKPQGDGIARRWYNELSDARATLKGRTTQGQPPRNVWTTPSSTTSFSSPSTRAPSVFSSSASVSSVDSMQSGPRLFTFGSEFSSQEAKPVRSDQSFKDPAVRNLNPLFRSMAHQPQ